MPRFHVKTDGAHQIAFNMWSKHGIQFENLFANFYAQFGGIKGSN